jgi:hypothetical protein
MAGSVTCVLAVYIHITFTTSLSMTFQRILNNFSELTLLLGAVYAGLIGIFNGLMGMWIGVMVLLLLTQDRLIGLVVASWVGLFSFYAFFSDFHPYLDALLGLRLDYLVAAATASLSLGLFFKYRRKPADR